MYFCIIHVLSKEAFMLSFFTILLILVGANILIMVFSLSGIVKSGNESELGTDISEVSPSPIIKRDKSKSKKTT